MLRICLIVALVAGLAGVAVSQLRVKEKITGLNNELVETSGRLTASQEAERKAKKTALDAKAAEEKATRELETAKADLETTTARAAQQQARADDNEKLYNTTLKEKNDAQSKLAAWEALGPTPDQIKVIMAENKKLVGERKGLDEIITKLNRNLKMATNELAIYRAGNEDVPLPRELRGRVLAVDPKYEFVVLDIGEKQGALARGKMLVSRSGRDHGR
jgi:flagellar biosynthesis GTPase FlhF